MSVSSMAHMDFVLATAEDYEELMSISGGIYKGMDYLPFRYHAWLKDNRRRMYLAKSEGKIVGFESFLLVDDGETAVVEGLRVAPWMRGQGVAGIIQRFVLDILHSDHPQVKRVRLTRAGDPPPSMLLKYKVLSSKALVSMFIPSDQLQEVLGLWQALLDNVGQLNNFTVLQPAEVLKLFDGTNAAEDLLPGGLLVQGWLPVSPKRSNLEILIERKSTWMYTHPQNTSSSLVSSGEASLQSHKILPFLSLGTPPFLVPYADSTYGFDIDMFGVDPACVTVHAIQQLKLCIQSLPTGSNIICVMYAMESLRDLLNELRGGLTPVLPISEQMVLEMDI